MKKLQTYKGFVIAVEPKDPDNTHFIFTKDEYSYGEGRRSPEWEACNLGEAKEFIDCY